MYQQSIAIGFIFNHNQQILVSKRSDSRHLAGYWEFPGGKVEPGESFKLALRRELEEELGIRIHKAAKVLSIKHRYSDRYLAFQCFKITCYSGQATSKINQSIQWVNLEELKSVEFPEANRAMVDALTLPPYYMIADEYVTGKKLIAHVDTQLKSGIKLIQHRASYASKSTYVHTAQKLKAMCEQHNAIYLANCPLDWLSEIKPHGIHVKSDFLKTLCLDNTREDKYKFFSASCHNEEEVEMANQLSVRCQLVGSVDNTLSHPANNSLGWKRFNHLCTYANTPVYALGGMKPDDYISAVMHGGQGIAAIRAFVSEQDIIKTRSMKF